MAPGLLTKQSLHSNGLDGKSNSGNEDATQSIFPDGIRTSGQHPPLYEVLRPHSDFPDEIRGPTVWTRDEFTDNLQAWTHALTEDETRELSAVADLFIDSGTELTGISQVSPTSALACLLCDLFARPSDNIHL
jgi:hypothetical protein